MIMQILENNEAAVQRQRADPEHTQPGLCYQHSTSPSEHPDFPKHVQHYSQRDCRVTNTWRWHRPPINPGQALQGLYLKHRSFPYPAALRNASRAEGLTDEALQRTEWHETRLFSSKGRQRQRDAGHGGAGAASRTLSPSHDGLSWEQVPPWHRMAPQAATARAPGTELLQGVTLRNPSSHNLDIVAEAWGFRSNSMANQGTGHLGYPWNDPSTFFFYNVMQKKSWFLKS